jgi:hypothetical protein
LAVDPIHFRENRLLTPALSSIEEEREASSMFQVQRLRFGLKWRDDKTVENGFWITGSATPP